MSLPPLSFADFVELAPIKLHNRRLNRYHGDDLAISMASFTPADRERVAVLYHFLQGLFAALQGTGAARDQALRTFLGQQEIEALIDLVSQFGPESYEASPSPLLAKTIHDVRGGGLTPLIGHLQLWYLGGGAGVSCEALYFLTRDHLKIMRNALLGLDDAKREEDLQIKIHRTDFIVEKWQGATLKADTREIHLAVHCPQSVAISECCVEFGALDRVLYNLLNNACRHTAGARIELTLFPIPDADGENLRFILVNQISSADDARLAGTELQTLFREGVSTTGSGYGLNVAADFVANAFGLASPEEAVSGQYIGATVRSQRFVIWFHWPIVAD